ncbi:hypothetical protein J3Q64DRAFT_1849594 [Phycomyces blakesleeanus]|uniref:Rho-GAP domain-containing protein n=2 Tax=Phycomyces blakesleeanus TaxID=4837 RepID=A0A167MA31_PHYB8|nr:hypothetical protein PHYBLDRAFT_146446 [Phycomyces blakesleeanus NRRL 1555(-)]OAD72244.1 hypothetical protein PHYBLDRAFT_146446 [Phycomyces blakesleeanus NRRL 1555(-)]|eukprot:XP_018290284.1 hypothetical protein PHYBLDRAFT_146446 [Phycomyces blakesleeanus NRRL 1555(-)]
MYYSFDFAAQVVHLCMDEIRHRGLEERKLLRKSVPNSVLFIKVFKRHRCSAIDLTCVDIHSVATLMQDILVCCQERIISKKAWRIINYETCTLSGLSRLLTEQGEQLLIDLLDFLVELMHYKEKNGMDAYRLGEAMGKVTLGPSECNPVMAEKAGHFLTRMIIEHSKLLTMRGHKRLRRIDSGFERGHELSDGYHKKTKTKTKTRDKDKDKTNSHGSYGPSSNSTYNYYCDRIKPMTKREAGRAKAKYYDRLIRKTKSTTADWVLNLSGVQAMLDDTYADCGPDPPEKPWLSIFSTTEELMVNRDSASQPLLFRILMEANKPVVPVPANPFGQSYLFSASQAYQVESCLGEAFKEFAALCYSHPMSRQWVEKTTSPLAKLNHSISNLKLNIRKIRSRHDIGEEDIGGVDRFVGVGGTGTGGILGPGGFVGVPSIGTAGTAGSRSGSGSGGGGGDDSLSRDDATYIGHGESDGRSSTGDHQKKPKNMKRMMRRVIKMGGNMVLKRDEDKSL